MRTRRSPALWVVAGLLVLMLAVSGLIAAGRLGRVGVANSFAWVAASPLPCLCCLALSINTYQ